MDLRFSEAQKTLRKSARDFLNTMALAHKLSFGAFVFLTTVSLSV